MLPTVIKSQINELMIISCIWGKNVSSDKHERKVYYSNFNWWLMNFMHLISSFLKVVQLHFIEFSSLHLKTWALITDFLTLAAVSAQCVQIYWIKIVSTSKFDDNDLFVAF